MENDSENSNDHPLVGLWFRPLSDDQWCGKVISSAGQGWYLVRIFNKIREAKLENMILVKIEGMSKWTFYSDEETMANSPKTGNEISTLMAKTTLDASVLFSLELGARSKNCLINKYGEDMTLGELVAKTESELGSIKNLGRVSLHEIKIELRKLGLALRGQTPLLPMKWSMKK